MSVQDIYVALFGRPADPGGLRYWDEVTKNGADLSLMLDQIPHLPEYRDRFQDMSDTQIISSVYFSLFNRPPEQEELDFLSYTLASGTQTLASLPVSIINGAQGVDKDILASKIAAADLFVNRLDRDEERTAYDGDLALKVGQDFLGAVTVDEAVSASFVDAVILRLFPGAETLSTALGPDTTQTFGTIDETGQDTQGNVIVDTGISAENFEITKVDDPDIEIALKGIDDQGDAERTANAYIFDGDDEVELAYSLVSEGEETIDELLAEEYSFHLKLDTCPKDGFGENTVELTLEKQPEAVAGPDSGYNWVAKDPVAAPIVDDEGNGMVTQNTIALAEIGVPEIAEGVVAAGEYSVALEVRKDGETVASEEITLAVAAEAIKPAFIGTLSGTAAKNGTDGINAAEADTKIFHGRPLSPDQFKIVHFDVENDGISDFEIALGGHYFDNGFVDAEIADGDVLRFASGGTFYGLKAPGVKYSVAQLGNNWTFQDLLARYDIKLFIDQEGADYADFHELKAVLSSDVDGGALDWLDVSDGGKITSDAGHADISQGYLSLGLFDKSNNHNGYATAPGAYAIKFEIYEKDTVNLIGSNSVLFEVGTG